MSDLTSLADKLYAATSSFTKLSPDTALTSEIDKPNKLSLVLASFNEPDKSNIVIRLIALPTLRRSFNVLA